MFKQLLCINVRPQNVADFAKISARISALAPEIGILGRPGDYHESMIPEDLRSVPRLTIYLVNPPSRIDAMGALLFVAKIDKYEQYKSFISHGVPCPRTIIYEAGMTVDEDEWGANIILKPSGESLGRGVFLVPTKSLTHPSAGSTIRTALRGRRYILQEWINPGSRDEIFRVLVFLGEPLLSYRTTGTSLLKLPSSLEEALQSELFQPNRRDRLLAKEDDVLEIASKAAMANPFQPLQGIDVCRDFRTGKLYVLENNAGGNVWSFSRKEGSIYKKYGSGPLIRQFNAFSKSADLLIHATRTLAHSELNA